MWKWGLKKVKVFLKSYNETCIHSESCSHVVLSSPDTLVMRQTHSFQLLSLFVVEAYIWLATDSGSLWCPWLKRTETTSSVQTHERVHHAPPFHWKPVKHGRNLWASFGLQKVAAVLSGCYAHITKSTGSTGKINPHNKEATLTQ